MSIFCIRKLIIDGIYKAEKKTLQNVDKQDPGRARQNNYGTAVINFTNPKNKDLVLCSVLLKDFHFMRGFFKMVLLTSWLKKKLISTLTLTVLFISL